MAFSYGAVWDDTLKLIRLHAPHLTAIVGVFIFLPALMFAIFLKQPEAQGMSPERTYQIMMAYFSQAAPWFMGQILLSMIATVSMLRLVFARQTTVGEALVHGIKWLPWYILLALLMFVLFALCMLPFLFAAGIVVAVVQSIPVRSLILFVVALVTMVAILYLSARLVTSLSIMVAENRRNPIETIGRSLALTRKYDWAIAGLLFVVIVVGVIAMAAINTIFGIVFILLAGQNLGQLLSGIVTSVVSSAFTTLTVMLYAAIYRGLTGNPDSVAETFN